MKKKYIIILSVLGGIILLISIILLTQNSILKNKSKLTIIDASYICTQIEEKIYEDDKYTYSLPCVKSDSVYVKFENGNKFLKAFDDKEIQELAWKNYGFRVEGTGGVSDVSVVDMKGIPSRITSGAKGLKMDSYNRLIEYLKEGV